MPKTLVIYFPQYHQDPLNDKNWGVNFTDWDSLRASSKQNKYKRPIPRPLLEEAQEASNSSSSRFHNTTTTHIAPPPILGYYDLLHRAPRKNQGLLAKQYGVDGFIYHHYWFYDPHPTNQQRKNTPNLAKSLEKMLRDGYPDLPFAFNWCTVRWVNVWMGKAIFQKVPTNKNRAIILQEQYFNATADAIYQHYVWLKQFFLHPNYITIQHNPIFYVYHYDARVLPIVELLRQYTKEDPTTPFTGLHLIVGRSSYPPDIYTTQHLAATNPRAHEVLEATNQGLDLVNPMTTAVQTKSIYADAAGDPTSHRTSHTTNHDDVVAKHFWNYTPFNQSMTYPYPLEYITKPYELPQWCTARQTGTREQNNSNNSTNKNNTNTSSNNKAAASDYASPEIIGVITAFDNSPRRPHKDATVYMGGTESPHDALRRFENNYYVALYYQKCCIATNSNTNNKNPTIPTENTNPDTENGDNDDAAADANTMAYHEDRFVAINSWNEWAEGMAIEPSDVYGYQWLEIIHKVKTKVHTVVC